MPREERRSGIPSPTEPADGRISMSNPGLPANPNPGDVIAGKYRVDRILGKGGMGIVLAARHMELGQWVAIKFMHAEVAADRGAAERFLREARAAVALTSEHVAKVMDVGRLDRGEPYMIMEYLAGEDLARVLRSAGKMPVAMAVNLVLQACDALSEAHGLGIIHRDLKPANLFVTTRRDGTPLVKVLDFGISKAASSGDPAFADNLTASGMVMGSPGYMAPEQIRNSKDVDARADVWSLGVILYELLTGVSPFLGETMADTFAKIITESPVPPRQRRADVPVGLSRLVMRCLERRVEDRTQSVTALALQLAEFAPPEATPIIERMRREGAVPAAGPREETLLAPHTLGPSGTQSVATEGSETGPAWLRSASARPRSSPRRLVAGIAIAVGLLGVGAGVAAVLGRSNPPANIPTPAAAPAVPLSDKRPSQPLVDVPDPARPSGLSAVPSPSPEPMETASPAARAVDGGGHAASVAPSAPPHRPPSAPFHPIGPKPASSSTPPKTPNESDIF